MRTRCISQHKPRGRQFARNNIKKVGSKSLEDQTPRDGLGGRAGEEGDGEREREEGLDKDEKLMKGRGRKGTT